MQTTIDSINDLYLDCKQICSRFLAWMVWYLCFLLSPLTLLRHRIRSIQKHSDGRRILLTASYFCSRYVCSFLVPSVLLWPLFLSIGIGTLLGMKYTTTYQERSKLIFTVALLSLDWYFHGSLTSILFRAPGTKYPEI